MSSFFHLLNCEIKFKMEEIRNPLMVVVVGDNFKTPKGVKAFKFNNKCFIWVWCDSKIHIYETSIHEHKKLFDELERDPSKKNEVILRSCVIAIFQGNDSICVLDENGVFYSLQLIASNPVNYMEVEDLFSSPTTSESISEWKATIVTKVSECDRVKHFCTLSSSIAIVGVKEEHLTVVVYSLPEYKFKFLVDLNKYESQDAILSSCAVSLMSPSLKPNFKENLEVFDEEIIVIGLASGLLLWFCTNNPFKGPFVLFHAHQEVQSIHWIKDSNSGLYRYLLVLLSSGQIVVFGGETYSTLYLPDSVKSSCCSKNFIVTSNFVDCYASEIQMDKNISLNYVSLPVKGVCAMTCAPGSDSLLIAATAHGSVYCFDPTMAPPENSSPFTLPDQSLLDNMFHQSQNLDRLYKQLNHEEDILKAVSATVAANCGKRLFQATVKVVSDSIFSVMAKIIDSKVIFSCALWSVCVEVINESGQKEISFHKMEHDFSNNSDLIVSVSHLLSVSDVVSVELVYFMESNQPLLIIPVGKVEIDACYLMCSQIISESPTKTEETLESILDEMENELPKQTLNECKLSVELPADCPVNSFFKTILACSQQRFTLDEWNKLSSGRNFNVSVCISRLPVLLKLKVETRELIITSSSTKLCHQVKEAVATRLKCSVKKSISETLTLDLQAILQTFEIESLKEKPSGETLDLLRKNLRASVSTQLAM